MRILGVDSRGLASPTGTIDYKCVLVQYDEAVPSACCVLGAGPTGWVVDYGDPIHSASNANFWFPAVEAQLAVHGLRYSTEST